MFPRPPRNRDFGKPRHFFWCFSVGLALWVLAGGPLGGQTPAAQAGEWSPGLQTQFGEIPNLVTKRPPKRPSKRPPRGQAKPETKPEIPTHRPNQPDCRGVRIGKLCVSRLPIPKLCPPGTIPTAAGCRVAVQPKPDCPRGYRLRGGECQRIVRNPPKPRGCPKGYRPSRKGCVAVAKKPRRCPRGYVRRAGRCVSGGTVVSHTPPQKILPPPPQRKPRKPKRLARKTPVPDPVPDKEYRPGEVVAAFPLNASEAFIRAVGRDHGLNLQRLDDLPLISLRLVTFTLPSNKKVPDAVAALMRDSRVLFTQPNYVYRLLGAREGKRGKSMQYALARIGAWRAHSLGRGAGVLVALIDGGVDAEHAVLKGALAGRYAALAAERYATAHGTAVASLIAGRAKAGLVTGVAPEARLLSVRAFGAPGKDGRALGSSLAVLRGMQWALDRGARIFNLSFAGPKDPLLARAVAKAWAEGAVLVAASGNGGPSAPPAYPAAYDEVIAVTATDAQDRLFPQANRGAYVTVAAPGVDVFVAAPEGRYDMMSGTSLAAAYVTGLAALLRQREPDLSPEALAERLQRTARDLGPPGQDPQFGYGLVDCVKALTYQAQKPPVSRHQTVARQ